MVPAFGLQAKVGLCIVLDTDIFNVLLCQYDIKYIE